MHTHIHTHTLKKENQRMPQEMHRNYASQPKSWVTINICSMPTHYEVEHPKAAFHWPQFVIFSEILSRLQNDKNKYSCHKWHFYCNITCKEKQFNTKRLI